MVTSVDRSTTEISAGRIAKILHLFYVRVHLNEKIGHTTATSAGSPEILCHLRKRPLTLVFP